MLCARIASTWAVLPRIASKPPWTAGCSVLTRPSIISGNPVRSLTSSTLSPASLSVIRVPPVETSSTPKPANVRAKSTTPVLSETEMRARVARRRCSVMASLYSLPRLRGRVGRGSVACALVDSSAGLPPPARYARSSPASGGGNSQRQPRLFLFADAAGRGARWISVLQAPLHARGGAGVAVDDDLGGAARAFAAGEINAVLEVDAVLVG